MLVVLAQKVEERSKDIWKIDTQMDPAGGRGGCLRQGHLNPAECQVSRLYPLQVRITPSHRYPPRSTHSWATLGFRLQADSKHTHTGFLSFPAVLKLCSVAL